MIDAKDYILIYFCKRTGRQVSAKKIGDGEVSIFDSGMIAKYSNSEARKLYRCSKENRKAKNKPKHAVLNMRNGFLCSKKYHEYLNGSNKTGTEF